MKKAAFHRTLNEYFKNMEWYRHFLKEIARSVKERKEKIEIYEAFVTTIHARWEILCEDLFVDCLNRDTTQYSKSTGVPVRKHLNRDMCRQILTGTGYFDVRSVGNLKGNGKKYLVRKYNPFQSIENSETRLIDEFSIIRNYLCHHSRKSKQAIVQVYKKRPYKLNRFYRPGSFLAAFDPISKQIRFLNYINAYFEASSDMADYLGV